MSKRKWNELLKRSTAYLLTLALVCSLFMGSGITGYASENALNDPQQTNESDTVIDGEENNGDDIISDEGSGEEPGEEAGENSGGGTDADTSEEKPDDVTGEEKEEGSLEETEGTGEEPNEEPGEGTGEEIGENPNEGIGEEIGIETGETEEEKDTPLKEELEQINTEGYIGNVHDGGLEISSWEMESFDEASVKALLENYSGQKFEWIYVSDMGEDHTIDAGIYNALIPYLDTSREGHYELTYSFGDVGWSFQKPKMISSDLNGNVNLSAGEKITVSVPEAASFAGCAEDVSISFDEEKNAGVGSAMANILGSEHVHCYLWTSDSDTEVSDASADWWPEEQWCHLVIAGIQNLESGKEYTVAPKAYKGDTWESNGQTYLDINEWKMGDQFNGEGVAKLLSTYYTDQTFHCIYIQAWDQEGYLFNKEVYNAVLPYLKADYEGRRIYYHFNLDNGNGGTFWTFVRPKEMTQDLSGAVSLRVENGRAIVNFSETDAFGEASVSLFEHSRAENYGQLEAVFGKSQIDGLSLFSVETSEKVEDTGAFWGVNEDSHWLSIGSVQNLQKNTDYYVEKYIYRGDTWQNEDGTSEIYISAFGLHENGKFSSGELKSIIDWYAQQGITFDAVQIEEAYSANNVIKKDYINQARAILNPDENSESRLTFVFCRCENKGEEEKGNDVKWNLYRPSVASKDITANASFTSAGNYSNFAVSVSNTYNAETASVTFRVDQSLELGSSIKAAYQETEGERLSALKGGTALVDNVHGGYWQDDDGAVNLEVSCIQNCAAKTNYAIVRSKYAEAPFNVGEETKLSEDARLALTATPDGAVTWRAHSENEISIAGGVMSGLNEGHTYVSASYQSGGKAYLDLFEIDIENRITRIILDRTKLTMELWKTEDGSYAEDCLEYLNIKSYPSEAGCDQENPEEITWTTSNANIVELVQNEAGNYTGEIRAKAPGTATITATYIKDGADLTASCVVTVCAPLEIADEDWPDHDEKLYAITNFDTKLSDVELPEGWKWVSPNTALSTYKGVNGHAFSAAYTATDAGGNVKTETHNLWVRMVTITGVSIIGVEETNTGRGEWTECEIPASITTGEHVCLNYRINVKNGTEEEIIEEWKNRMEVKWSTKPGGLGNHYLDSDTYDFCVDEHLSKEGRKPGKKTFTLTIKNKATGKTFATASKSITVTAKAVLDFDEDVIFDMEASKLIFKVRKSKYDLLSKNKVTFKSEDTGLIKIDKVVTLKETENIDDDEYVVIELLYTQKGVGDAYVTAKAADEIGSSRKYCIRLTDSMPKLLTPSVTINKKLENEKGSIQIVFEYEYPFIEADGAFRILDNDNFCLDNVTLEDENHFLLAELSIKEGVNVKKGTYKVKLQVPVKSDTEEKEYEAKTVTVTVKVTETVPDITVKQTKKVNSFYTDEEGYGLLRLSVKDALIIDPELTGCDFELKEVPEEMGQGCYYIALKDGKTGKAKNGTLTYHLETDDGTAYVGSYKKSVNIGITNSKPKIVLSAKKDTLYPEAGYGASWLGLTDKSTGEDIVISEARYVQNKKKNQYVNIPGAEEFTDDIKIKYNSFNMRHETNGLLFLLTGTPLAKTDSLTIQVKESNWSQYLDVSYKIKVDKTVKPKLKLGNTTITLNKNDAVYNGQQVKTMLSLSGCSNILDQDDVYVSFSGTDAKSNKILKTKGSLILQYWKEQGCIVARFNDNDLDAGTYKYKVTVGNDVFNTSTTLTVKVIDKAEKDCLSVTAKGSIDLLQREKTSIAYTPKLKNVTGHVEDGWLTGENAGLFDYYFENGKLYVQARVGENYSTAVTYKVKAVFWVQPEDHSGYEVESKVLSIKLKQGKPKVSVSSNGNTLYRSVGNCVEVNISALLGSQEVVIEDVSLLNYTKDLWLIDDFYNANPDENGDPWYMAYNPDTKSVLLTTTGEAESILKSGKTWKVKLAVRYRDQAGNAKDAQVTYKVVVK